MSHSTSTVIDHYFFSYDMHAWHGMANQDRTYVRREVHVCLQNRLSGVYIVPSSSANEQLTTKTAAAAVSKGWDILYHVGTTL